MRIRIVKNQGSYKKSDIVDVSPNVAFGLIDSGVGVISKDIVETDYKIKALDEEQANGKSTKLRTNKSR